ncbi:MAG: family 78 glycoside hydrolase catalytic domain, partial [Agathobacter sp.]|nr:family 78 glycoside hydrolase catalytic domain [Agathobacter sp.]
MKAIRLRTEYLENPIGIDYIRPRLSWNCEGGLEQKAYRIVAKAEDDQVIWDSGKVESSQMIHIPWDGPNLTSRTKVTWSVGLWDEQNQEEWSEEATFELGLLEAEDWKASWITGDYKVKSKERYPVDYFRKRIEIAKPVAKARLYATACGLYESSLNGEKNGNFCLAPGITDYRKRIQYQTIDVTKQLVQGINEWQVLLADGWYRGSVGAHGLTNAYGKETKFLGQLEVTYTDGSTEMFCTDGSWDWSNDGPIRFADNKDGEYVDATYVPSFCGKAKVTHHDVIPSASNNVLLQENETFVPKLITTPSGKKVLDFGQNFAGYVSFSFWAKEGEHVRLRFGEMFDKNGEFTQKNIQCVTRKKTSPLQQVDYICKEGLNTYKTRFAIFGFQYVEVESSVEFKPEDFVGYAVYSAFERTGYFESSNALLNQLVDATLWSTKSNSADLPTDCPTRERHGWTGDAQIFFKTASYLVNYAPFAKKYLRDVFDWQKKNGRLPHIAPEGGADFYMWVMNGSVGWSDVGIILPFQFAQMYQDPAILENYYQDMKRYAHFMQRRCGKWGGPYAKPLHLKGKARKYRVNRGQSYGEWAEPEDICMFKWYDFASPHPEVSMAYTVYMMDLMICIAKELGHEEDIPNFAKYRDGVRDAYQQLVKTPRYKLDTDRQAQLVRPLALELLNEEQTTYAKKRLLAAMENYGWRLGTGFLSTPLILNVLADIDVEAAYRLLENEEIPGWLSMPKAGATTIWESWEGPNAKGEGCGSLNHYSKGAVCEWLFGSMCGIQVAEENNFIISPIPGGSFTYAKAEYDS